MFVEVVVDSPILEKEESLLYQVPKILEKKIQVGQVVLVPLGKFQKRGIVINIKKEKEEKNFTIKEVKNITFDYPVLSKTQIEVIREISGYYLTPFYKVMRLFLPKNIFYGDHILKKENYFLVNFEKKVEFSKQAKKRQNLYLDILNLKKSELSNEDLKNLESFSVPILKKLIEVGFIIKKERDVISNLAKKEYKIGKENKDLKLNEDQENVYQKIINSPKQYHLIHGITGSGKTEVYIKIAQQYIEKNKSVIILIPEINLTPQTIKRFIEYFPEEIAIWHSQLNDTERFNEWKRIKDGQARIILGSRSALFTPVNDLGLIIIDEEHDQSYKQDKAPRYHARRVASFFAEKNPELKVILGSATPSIESFYSAKKGYLELHTLEKRFSKDKNPVSLPIIDIVDLREGKKHLPSIIGHILYLNIAEALEAKRQVVLLLNKRGSFHSMQCLDCGHSLTCPRCDIPYTVHRLNDNSPFYRLLCHYCGKEDKVPLECTECGGILMRGMGFGTQTIELELKSLFKTARILRADSDSVSKKGSHKKIYDTFYNHEADILIGTQMISKGLDIPNVGLVGVLLADIGLSIPNFRSEERIFSLLTQVAGRAGRRDVQGRVIIQTFSPDNPAIIYAKKQDYSSFYDQEIKKREQFKYPPFCSLMEITAVDYNEEKAKKEINELYKTLKGNFMNLEILGPAPSIMPKIYNKYHYQIIIKALNKNIFKQIKNFIPKNFRIDIDPR